MSYYNRSNVVHIDGTHIFQTDEDRGNEQNVASILEKQWGCSLKRFGALSPIDWFAERHGRLIGVLELKSRPHSSDLYNTVFLNVRKWLALTMASVGLGCPSLFVVKFTDGILWIRTAEIDASNHKIGGCSRLVKSHNDIEPLIEVVIASMIRMPT